MENIFWTAFGASLSAAMVTSVGIYVIRRIDQPLLGALLSFSAGALIYVGATHLLPQAEKEQKNTASLHCSPGFW